VLQKTISCIQPATWERINQRLFGDANQEQVELGKKIRIDSTVTETTIHAPTDSSLLWDSARLCRDLIKATTNTLGNPEQAEMVLRARHVAELPVAPWHVQVDHYKP